MMRAKAPGRLEKAFRFSSSDLDGCQKNVAPCHKRNHRCPPYRRFPPRLITNCKHDVHGQAPAREIRSSLCCEIRCAHTVSQAALANGLPFRLMAAALKLELICAKRFMIASAIILRADYRSEEQNIERFWFHVSLLFYAAGA